MAASSGSITAEANGGNLGAPSNAAATARTFGWTPDAADVHLAPGPRKSRARGTRRRHVVTLSGGRRGVRRSSMMRRPNLVGVVGGVVLALVALAALIGFGAGHYTNHTKTVGMVSAPGRRLRRASTRPSLPARTSSSSSHVRSATA